MRAAAANQSSVSSEPAACPPVLRALPRLSRPCGRRSHDANAGQVRLKIRWQPALAARARSASGRAGGSTRAGARAHPQPDGFIVSGCPPRIPISGRSMGKRRAGAASLWRAVSSPAAAGRTTPPDRPMTARSGATGRAAPSPLCPSESTGLSKEQIRKVTPIADRGARPHRRLPQGKGIPCRT